MAYNGFLPVNYQQPFTQVYPQSFQQNGSAIQTPNGSSILWVKGIEGAKAYPVAAGGSVLLMDSEENVFYIKSSDQSGMPMPLRMFDYTERREDNKSDSVDMSNYVTKDELDQALAKVSNAKKKKRVEEEDDE